MVELGVCCNLLVCVVVVLVVLGGGRGNWFVGRWVGCVVVGWGDVGLWCGVVVVGWLLVFVG